MTLRSRLPVVFLLSSIRSGSTLLRCMLNAHPNITAPHELHLGGLRVTPEDEYSELALQELGWTGEDLEFLLSDRIYHEILANSGKEVLVDKSPSNLWRWPTLLDRWPQAYFLFLHRDPAAIARSIVEARDGRDASDAVAFVSRAVEAMQRAHQAVPRRLSIRYEELTAEPERTLRAICDWIGVPYHMGMLEYGAMDHGRFIYGIGDWGQRIATGRVLAADTRRLDGALAATLQSACAAWGYPGCEDAAHHPAGTSRPANPSNHLS